MIRAQPGSLRAKIQRSAQYSVFNYGMGYGLRLISTLVLTRLLAPEIYGVFAVVFMYMYLLEMSSDLGLRSLILTKEGKVTDDFLRTCWTVSILRGLAILVLSCVIGGGIIVLQGQGIFAPDSPYAAEALPWAIACLGLGAFVYGFESPMRFMRERGMAFGHATMVDTIRNIATLVVTIALAYYLRSVWALVIGNMIRSVFHVGLSFAVFRGLKVYPALDRDHLRLLLGRGKWILGQSMLTALAQSSDRLFLGVVMNSTTFGFYFIARQLVDMVPQFLRAMNGQMGLQVFSRLHKQSAQDFRRNFYRYRLVFDALAGLSAGGLMMVAPLLVEIIFDDRYAGVATFMQILILAVLPIAAMILRSIFNANREFNRTTQLSLLSVIVLWSGMAVAIFVFDSTMLAVLAIALYQIPETLLMFFIGKRRGWVSLRREPMVLAFFALGAGLGWAVMQLWEYFI